MGSEMCIRDRLNTSRYVPSIPTALPPLARSCTECFYLWGFIPLEAFVSFGHPILLAPRLPFLPLLLTSVYCSVGVHYSAGLCQLLWREQSAGRGGAKRHRD